MALLNSPTADLAMTFTPNTSTGQITVDLALSPANDLKLVAGPARLAQDITRWLLTPQGAYVFDPAYGNPMLGQLMRPGSADPNVYVAMIQAAEAYFLQAQQLAAAQGYLSLDEQVLSMDSPTVTIGDNGANGPLGTVTVAFTITTRAGSQVPAFAPFSALS